MNSTKLNLMMLLARYLHPGSIAGALGFHRGRSNGRSAVALGARISFIVATAMMQSS